MANRNTRAIAVLIVSLAVAVPAAAPAIDAPTSAVRSEWELMATRYLPGIWNVQYSVPGTTTLVSGTSRYSADGGLQQKMKVRVNGTVVSTASASGTWEVRGNKLYVFIEESSVGEAVGSEASYTILELTPSRFRYSDDSTGHTVIETRLGD